jgi:hypothetical protein
MKKLFIILMLAVSLVSCKKDDPKPEPVPTTYYVVNGSPTPTKTLEFMDGTLWEVTVYCFDSSGDVVREDILDPIATNGGKSIKTVLTANIVKLVVSFKFAPEKSIYYTMSDNYRRYTFIKFVVTPNVDNKIELNGETTISRTMSKTAYQQLIIKNFENLVIHKN